MCDSYDDFTVLVVGGGGREHTIAWSLLKNHHIKTVFVCPGNAGILLMARTKLCAVDWRDHSKLLDFCRDKSISLTVVAGDDPLADGLVDSLEAGGVLCFGPTKSSAKIEWSKAFSKDFMIRHGIPTARYLATSSLSEALKFIDQADFKAWVVKADGLAAGKGVFVAKSNIEAKEFARQLLEERSLGAAGETVVVEELLEGDEVSVFCFSDGEHIRMMPTCQDHKRLLDGDLGPNTGGMGAYSPYPFITKELLATIKETVMQKCIDGLREEGAKYKGVLYAGIMLSDQGFKVLEFNSRFGDPETQVILPQLKSDLLTIMTACAHSRLTHTEIQWNDEESYVTVALVSGGYPGSYAKGFPITGIDQLPADALVFQAGTSFASSSDPVNKSVGLVTSGGRVLHVVGHHKELLEAARMATNYANEIMFDGAFFRKDIGKKALDRLRSPSKPTSLTYEASGVSIDAGNQLVARIGPACSSSSRNGADVRIGGFGGCFDLKEAGYKDPILISGTDGVGTKLAIAHEMDNHSTIGIDLVAMCVNDILVHGAEPLYFLDYFATSRLDVDQAASVIEGIATGCRMAGCALIGGETAEMPGFYAPKSYDLAGFAVGAVERDGVHLPMIESLKVGDIVMGISSSGLHSNGFSLVRRCIAKAGLKYSDPCPWGGCESIGAAALIPTKIYVSSLLSVLQSGLIKAAAHITGGGLVENVPRVLGDKLRCVLDAAKWKIPMICKWLHRAGPVSCVDMLRTFNCGIGMVLIVDPANVEYVERLIIEAGESVDRIGYLRDKDGSNLVQVDNMEPALFDPQIATTFQSNLQSPNKEIPVNGHPSENSMAVSDGVADVAEKCRVAVLLSGSGSNLQALIDHTQKPGPSSSVCEVALVVSNVDSAYGLTRAKKHGIPVEVLVSKDRSRYPTRADYDGTLHQVLLDHRIDLVCLAGFMRILTDNFCSLWRGKLINIHPSILPSFKGGHAVRDTLAAKVRVTGCTVHFAVADVDSGAIISQAATEVAIGDTEESLLTKIHALEHRIYPEAMELVASGQATFHPTDNEVIWYIK